MPIVGVCAVLVCLLLVPAVEGTAGAAGQVEFPDLINVIPVGDFQITHPTPQTKEFDYSHIVFNAGLGTLEVKPTNYNPATNLANGTQNVYSYDASGNKTLAQTHLATDQFFFYVVHNHYHFPLATFGIYNVNANGSVGTAVAISPKSGFCLGDDLHNDPSLPNSPPGDEYAGSSCAHPNDTRGISSGWGDFYDRLDPGMAIDLTGVPDGTYWFHSIVDPDNNFLESDKTNNTTDIKIRIAGDTITPISSLASQGSFLIDKSFLVDGVQTVSTPAFSTTSANELLVAFVAGDGDNSTTTANVSGGGLNWTLARRSNTMKGTAEVWTAMAPAPLANAVVTSSLSGFFENSLSVYAIRGAAGIGATAGGSGATGPPSTSLTTTTPGSWVMSVGADADQTLPAVPSSGQVAVHAYVDRLNNTSLWMEARPSPTPAAGTQVNFAHSYPSGDEWNQTSVEILPAVSNDHTPPVISNVSVSSLGSSRATITWDTDEPATSRVDYGTTPSINQSTPTDPALVTQHSVQVNGLTPSTGYSYQVASADSGANVATSGPFTFTTTPPGTEPAVISNVRITSLFPDQAIIAWDTDNPTNSQIDYGISSDYGASSPLDTQMTTAHFELITSLLQSTMYHYRVGGTDELGNFGTSADFSFQTPAIPPSISIDASTSIDGSGNVQTGPFSTTGIGETLVAFVSADGSPSTPQTATIAGGGLTWTLDARANAQTGDAEVWHAFAPGKVSNAVIASTLSSGGFHQSLSVIAFKGAVDIGARASASNGTGPPSASLSTNGARSLIFGAGSDPTSATAHVPVSGQSLVHQDLDTAASNTFWVQRLDGEVSSVDLHVDIADSAPSTDAFNLAIVEIRRPISIPPPLPVLPKISGITLAPRQAYSATVSWTTNVPATTQVVFGTTTLTDASPADLSGRTTHSITLTGLVPHTRYHYRIVSKNGVGEALATTRTLATGGPRMSVIVSTIPGDGKVTLKWKRASASDGLVTDYIVTPYVNGVAQPPIDFPSPLLIEDVTGLVNGTAYTFTVAGKNVVGTAAPSPQSAIVVAGSPIQPRSVRATPGAGQATVQWQPPDIDNGSTVTGYVVTAYIGGVAQPSQAIAAPATSLVVTGLTPGTGYNFTVSAVNGFGTGPVSRFTATVFPF